MNKTTSPNGWTLKQGLAAQYAAQAGIDPELGAQAGEAAWDVLRALRDAVEESDPSRKLKRVQHTQRRLETANLAKHRELTNQVGARLRSIVIRGGQPSVNPETGLQEFSVECADEGGCRQDYITADPIDTVTHRFVYNSAGNLTPNQPHVSVYDPSEFARPTPQLGRPGAPGSGLGAGIGGGYDPSVYRGVESGGGAADSDQGFFDSLLQGAGDIMTIGKPSLQELQTWNDEDILEEVRKTNSAILAYENMENEFADSDQALWAYHGLAGARNMFYLDQLLGVCRQRGLSCQWFGEEYVK